MKRPVLLYDGGCRFCRFVARVAARIDRGRYAYLPFDDAEAEPLLARLPEARRYASAHLVRPDGSIWSPSNKLYRLIADNRHCSGALLATPPARDATRDQALVLIQHKRSLERAAARYSGDCVDSTQAFAARAETPRRGRGSRSSCGRGSGSPGSPGSARRRRRAERPLPCPRRARGRRAASPPRRQAESSSRAGRTARARLRRRSPAAPSRRAPVRAGRATRCARRGRARSAPGRA